MTQTRLFEISDWTHISQSYSNNLSRSVTYGNIYHYFIWVLIHMKVRQTLRIHGVALVLLLLLCLSMYFITHLCHQLHRKVVCLLLLLFAGCLLTLHHSSKTLRNLQKHWLPSVHVSIMSLVKKQHRQRVGNVGDNCFDRLLYTKWKQMEKLLPSHLWTVLLDWVW
jgi:MFS superfamily sulfate permease-like transporter